ncbi:ABC transporter substrate-binding protein [Algoriphagus sediminis]|uniref:ABC transporter substrate-binding protein n=1 Tax=Algoriphagus sediminis TaxID=3057113 RepID=A0ABT7YGA6_9BACT|nr:ABC transporter substrate-binding protein [Algoriphagus sediminis]MDN3205555.1 ABC transporter substrate-binding protein [Algoriphagus sediminis]
MKVSTFSVFQVFLCFLLLIGINSCSEPKVVEEGELETIELEFAKGFSIKKGDEFYILEVNQPWTGADKSFNYLVLEENRDLPIGNFDVVISPDPQRLILTSTTHIPHLDLLGISDQLVGFPNTDLVSSEKARALIDQGLVKDLGSGPYANPEVVISMEPDLIVISTLGEDLKYLDLFKNAGIPAVINGEYVEQHPLGRAEWIKFTGILTGKFEESVKVFDEIKSDYFQAKDLAAGIETSDRPSVLSGIMYKEIWYAPGNDSWGARILQDAGGSYVFQNQNGTGSLQLNYEFVLENGINADYWIGSADFPSLEEMGKSDPRYKNFEAFKSGNVYTYTLKKGPTGGLEYFELGYMRPDLILKDLIKIMHPEILPDYELYFYQSLKND